MCRIAACLLIALSVANNATAQMPEVSKLWRAGHDDELGKYAVAFSPDGTAYLAAQEIAEGNNGVVIRSVKTHAQLQRIQITVPKQIKAISFTPDGKAIVCVGPGGVSRWNAKTGALERKSSNDAITDAETVVISPDSSSFAAGNKVFDTTTGEMRFQLDSAVGAPAFSPDGEQVAVVTAKDDESQLSVFDATTGRKSHELADVGFTFGGHGIAYTGDGKGIMAVTDSRSIAKYDARFGDWLWTSETVPGRPVILATTSDGTKLVSAAKDSVQIWDTEYGKLTAAVSGPGKLTGLAVTNHSIACVSSDGALCIWDMTGLETETQIAKRQALKEIGLLRGDQKAAIAWLQKDYRGKVHTESGTVIGIGLFNSYYGRSKVIDEWLGILVNFPQLKRLDLTNARITDKGLKQLASLGNLQELTLYGTKVTDPAIGELAPLKSLRSLNLEGTHVTDASMKRLGQHPSLQELNLTSAHITDAGLKELSTLQTLRNVRVGGASITDEGLKHLARLNSLESLTLWKTSVTDEGMKHVARMKHLTSLFLGRAQISNAGIKEIAKCKNLQSLSASELPLTFDVKELGQLKNLNYLDLEGTQTSDPALKHIGQLRNLTWLNLGRTAITDKGLERLSELKNLEFLDLRVTKVTDEGAKRLQGALPACDIRWKGAPFH